MLTAQPSRGKKSRKPTEPRIKNHICPPWARGDWHPQLSECREMQISCEGRDTFVLIACICGTRVFIINNIHLTLLEKFFVTSGWEAQLKININMSPVCCFVCVVDWSWWEWEIRPIITNHSTTSGVRYTNRTVRNVPTVGRLEHYTIHGHSATPAQPNWTLILIKSSPLSTHQHFSLLIAIDTVWQSVADPLWQ